MTTLEGATENRPPRITALTWILLGGVAFFVRYYYQGYIVYRSDQLAHVSLLRVLQDPTLFPRDVFLHEFSHGNMRYFYLLLLKTAGALFGLPFGLFALFALFYALTLWAFFLLSKKIFDSYVPGFLFGLIIACHEVADVGANGIVETQILPRMVATVALWWALYFTYLRRARLGAVLAGAALAASLYIHPLVPLQFWPFLVLWLLVTRRREGIVPVVLMSAVFLALGIPSFLRTGDVVQSYASKADPDALLLWVYVRAPHHLDINTWGRKLIELGVLAAVGGLVWWPLRPANRKAWDFGLLGASLALFTVAAAVVIEVYPAERIIMAQPFRLVVPLRAVLYLLLGHHVLGLLRRRTFWSYARGAALVLCGLEHVAYLCVMSAEIAALLVERRMAARQPEGAGLASGGRPAAVLLLAALALAAAVDSDNRRVVALVLLLAAAAAWAVPRPPVRDWFVRRGLPLGVAAGAALIAAMWFLPFERWIGNPDSSHRRRLAHFCFNHALRPYPIAAIEKVGAWARENTPRDALLLIPPGKQRAGFHPWAERSTVFTIKLFPYVRAGVKEWKKRYLAVRGIAEGDAKRIEEALRDSGAKGTDDDYAALSQEQALALARTYGAEYVVSEHEPPYAAPELSPVFEARDSDSAKSKPLRVYRVAEAGK